MRLLRRTEVLLAMTLVVLGCGGVGLIPQPVPTQTFEPGETLTPLPSSTATESATPTFLPTETFTLTPSPTETPTLVPSITPTPEFILQGPGEVVVPILLYHHIGTSPSGSLYYVSPEEFDRQMSLLYAWGYRTISIAQMVEAIRNGANLPSRPIILTFDDGSESVYTEALPIMRFYRYTGTAFIVYNYIGAAGLYLDADQIKALHEAGWEIGSHSLSHVNLRQRPDNQEDEIYSSKIRLESLLGFPIPVFAYPFGANDASSLRLVRESGYIAAVGLGVDVRQSAKNVYYLYRREISSTQDLQTFAGNLPWQEEMNLPPAGTSIP